MPNMNQENAVRDIVIKCSFLVFGKIHPTILNTVNVV